MIYEISGKQVMLDSGLARLYQVETKRINEAVRRNREKFPERFSFVLAVEESNIFEVQFATSKIHVVVIVIYHVYLLSKVLLCLQLY